MVNYILIGKLSNTHGIKGELKLYPYTDDINSLSKSLKVIYLDKELTEKYIVSSAKLQNDHLIVKLVGLDDIDDALKLKSRDVYISRDGLKKLEKGSYYISDLIGLDVVNDDGKSVGKLVDVFNTGANDIYEIKTENGTIYLPAIASVIKEINITSKQIIVSVMEGLV